MDFAAIVTASGSFVAAVGVIFAGYWSYRSKQQASRAVIKVDQVEARLVEIDGNVFELGKAVDGRLSQLLGISDVAAEAKGFARGEQAQRDRETVPDKAVDTGRRHP